MRAIRGNNRRRFTTLAIGVVLCGVAGHGALAGNAGASGATAVSGTPDGSAGAFMLTSPDLPVGATVPAIHLLNDNGCTGGNQSPALDWRNAPAGTAGYAISVYDPDAPGRGFWHWSVFGIPASTHSLPLNASASGAVAALGALQARNDFGSDGYGGPCPPPGRPHRYVISVHALRNLRTSLQSGRPAAVFAHEIDALEIAKASLTVVYGR
jgi:Raf kinase inhibitor-like YbhB/YbcL family protein